MVGIAMYWHLQYISPVVARAKNLDKKDMLQQGFSQKKVKDMGKFDCIVIGSGMGGMTAAALLSRIGKKVLILEQHDVLGGCTHTFSEEGFEFDTGLHYMGEEVTRADNPMGFLLQVLGLGQIEWSKMNSTYDHAIISPLLAAQKTIKPTKPSTLTNMEFTDNLDETIQRIITAFPEEEEAIRSYLRLVKWSKLLFPVFIALKVLPKGLSALVGMVCRRFLNTFMGTSTLQVGLVYDLCLWGHLLKAVCVGLLCVCAAGVAIFDQEPGFNRRPDLHVGGLCE